MTEYVKIAISLPTHVAEGARRAVRKGKSASLSAYVAEAVEEKAKSDDLAGLLAEMLESSGGPMTTAERREADRLLGFGRRKRVETVARLRTMAPKRPQLKKRR